MKTIENFINQHPQQELLVALNTFILETLPQVIPKIRYGIPFFDADKMICYLNPIKTGGINFCFLFGFEIVDDYGVLEQKNRKQVKSVSIKNLEDLSLLKPALTSYLLQSAQIAKI